MQKLDWENKVVADVLLEFPQFAAVLKQQWSHCSVVERNASASGIVTEVEMPKDTVKLCISNQALGSKIYKVSGMDFGVGAFVMIREGVIDFVEIYTFDGILPSSLILE